MKAGRRGEWTSASNALADRLCPGRHRMQQGHPEPPSTEESEAGRVVHALWTGTKPLRKPAPQEIQKAKALIEQEGLVAKAFFRNGEKPVRIVERRLWHSFAEFPKARRLGILRTSGQFDVALVHPQTKRALLLDGKSGWLPVTPTHSNLQLRRLAALLWLELDCHEIGVAILKPFGRGEAPCVYNVPELERSVLEMEKDVRLCHRPAGKRTAGIEQCRYCRAREQCPERLAWLSLVLPTRSQSLPMVSARDWTPAQRVLFLEREKEARDWLESRKEELKALLAENPDAVPGYGLKPGRILETVTDPQEVFKRFCRQLGGSLESFLKCIKLCRSALKAQAGALTGCQGMRLDAQIDLLLAGCRQVKRASPSIEKLK